MVSCGSTAYIFVRKEISLALERTLTGRDEQSIRLDRITNANEESWVALRGRAEI